MSFVDAYTDFIFIEDQPEQADMIFLPGSAEGALPVRAAQLWKEGYAPLVLPSGKYSKLTGYFTGHGDHETEWDYFHEILLKEGVADHAILQEKQATYTYENAIFSRKLTDKLGLDIKKAILVCQAYHARRASLYSVWRNLPGETIMLEFVTHNNFLKKKIDRVILHFLQIPTIIIDIKSNPKTMSGLPISRRQQK